MQPFYNRGRRLLGFSCLIDFFFMSVENHFFHTSDRSNLFVHTGGKINFSKIFFYKRFTSKFKHIFIKRRLVGLKLYINQNDQNIYYVSPLFQSDFFVRFFCFLTAKLIRTITFLSFQIGQLYLVCGCMTIRVCVAYHNDLCGTLTFDLKVK